MLQLNDSEVAWEFLRRNLAYQQDASRHEPVPSQPQTLESGQKVWRDRQHAPAALRWGLPRFVEPALRAPDAPIDWNEAFGAARIDALVRLPASGERPDLHLADLRCVSHIVITPDGAETLLINTSERALMLRLCGQTTLNGPVCLTFQIAGLRALPAAGLSLLSLPDLLASRPRTLDRSRRRLLMRDALVALDGRTAGASYREIAAVIAGAERAQAAWKSSDHSLKDRMRRALKAGLALCNGRYRLLIGPMPVRAVTDTPPDR